MSEEVMREEVKRWINDGYAVESDFSSRVVRLGKAYLALLDERDQLQQREKELEEDWAHVHGLCAQLRARNEKLEAVLEMKGWIKVSDRKPPRHERVEVRRTDVGIFVGTPCYGPHHPWWVPFTADVFAPGKVVFDMNLDDEWRAIAAVEGK